MKHRLFKTYFNRDTNARKALRVSLCRALLERGEIITTKPKSREVKRWIDKLLSGFDSSSLHSRRLLHKFFGKRDIVNSVAEKIINLLGERKSGFVKIKFVGLRKGDNSALYRASLVNGIINNGFKKNKVQLEEKKKVVGEKKVVPKIKN